VVVVVLMAASFGLLSFAMWQSGSRPGVLATSIDRQTGGSTL
jgi:hypothetical protein